MRKLFAILLLLPLSAVADIYTKADEVNTGGLRGMTDKPLTHAIAIERDRVRVYRATLTDGGRTFQFEHLPVGRYDLALITKDGGIYEGIQLGEDASALPKESLVLIRDRISKADTFFNKRQIFRIGLDGDHAFVLVERLRDAKALYQSGEVLNANVHRFEIADLQRAADDWQMIGTRHFYREPDSLDTKLFHDHFVTALQNIRIIDSPKDLGSLSLPTP